MKHRILVFLLVFGWLTVAPNLCAQQAIFLIRHAEKVDESNDPPLSKAGQARAQILARLLRDSGITAIYTSEFQRNVQTAKPLADLLKIKPVVMPSQDLEGLLKRIGREQSDGVVLIVGHTDTVPRLLKLLGYPGSISIAPREYDNLFVLFPRKGDRSTLLRLRFP
jgi:broad specificity phosphatase PhoE